MNTTNILQKLGLTDNEEKIYIGLLEIGSSTAADIARKLSMDKSSAYRAVENLYSIGLVIANPKVRGTTYSANGPDVLLKLYESKRLELEASKSSLDNFIESLKKDYESKRSTYITVEEGLSAHIKRMEESLESKEKLIRERFRDHVIFNENSYIDYVKDYAERRRKKGIFIRQLEQDFGRLYNVFPDIMLKQEYYNKEVRKLDPKMNDNNSLRIYDDVINIMSYDKNNDFLVITIKDKYVAELMKNMYDFIWDMSEKYE